MQTVTERLKAFRELGEYIDQQQNRLDVLEASTGVSGGGFPDGIPHGKGGTTDPTGRLAAAVTDLRDKIRRLVEEERAERRSLSECLRILPPLERSVMEMRFFDGMGWECIAEALGITDRGARKAGERAGRKLDEAAEK